MKNPEKIKAPAYYNVHFTFGIANESIHEKDVISKLTCYIFTNYNVVISLMLILLLAPMSKIFSQSVIPYKNLRYSFPSLSQLPVNPELPDPFLMFDGRRVTNTDEWLLQREYLKEMISYYEYGEAPPPPDWNAKETSVDTIYNGKAIDKRVTIVLKNGSLSMRLRLVRPVGNGVYPVVIKNDYTENSSSSIQEELVVNRGYALAVFNREDLSGDNSISTGVYKVYPEYNWGNLRVWGWGTSRVIDYLETQDCIDIEKICATGQSRGGKAAMLAAIFDERIAVCVPSGSGCAGMDLLRVLGCGEDLKDIAGSFPYWFSLFKPDERISQTIFFTFRNNIYKLPFDQHFCRALIAPRAIMSTDGLGDSWACPTGTQHCYSAAQPVFDFFGVHQNNAIHFRDGGHSQNAEDWTALADFCDQQFFGKTSTNDFYTTPFIEPDSLIKWSAPEKVSCNGLIISDSAINVFENSSFELRANLNPLNATNRIIKWSTNHKDIATVDKNGLVNAVKIGKATITATSADGKYSGHCVVTVDAKPESFVYFGSLHNHTSMSDGKGTPLEAYEYAKNVAKLDFFAVTDHETSTNSSEWTHIKEAASLNHKDSIFVTFAGFEWSSADYGHVLVVGSDVLIHSNDKNTNTFSGLSSWISNNNCVAFFNHPGEFNSKYLEFEHFQGIPNNKFVGLELFNRVDRIERSYSKDGYFVGDNNLNYFNEALIRGWKIGAAGGEDNHTADWGTRTDSRLAVISPAKTRKDIFDALIKKRFYVTEDKNLRLSFQLNNCEMGSVLSAGKGFIRINAKDDDSGESFSKIQLYRNGIILKEWISAGQSTEFTHETTTHPADYFYVKVTQEDNDQAISSPIWISGMVMPSVEVTDVKISEKNIILQVNETKKLTASVLPVNATNKHILWGSANKPVALVDSTGLVTGKSAGYADVWVRSADGNKLTICKVQVKNIPTEISSLKDNQNELVIFPNPANETINILLKLSIKTGMNIAVFDVCGNKIISQENVHWDNGYPIKLDISGLSTGSYIVSLADQTEVWTSKIFKK